MLKKKSIRLYHYKKEFQLSFDEIRSKISEEKKHQWPCNLRRKNVIPRFNFYEFNEVSTGNSDVLVYEINSERELEDGSKDNFTYIVYFSKKGYFILSEMKYRTSLIHFLKNLLYPKLAMFEEKYFSKEEILDFKKLILENEENIMVQPRFHFIAKPYRKREFNDFCVAPEKCATDDAEYVQMEKKSSWFEPVFNIKKLSDEEIECILKLNRPGYIYISKSVDIQNWLIFLKDYLKWTI